MNSKEIVGRYIGALEDDLQHYTMVDKDKVKAKFIEFQLEEYKTIKQDLDRLQTLEEENEELKTKLAVLEGVNQAFRETAIECNKLKQAISILKDIFEIVLCESDFPIPEIKYSFGFKFRKDCGAYVHISRIQYELLKEVFESVGDSDD